MGERNRGGMPEELVKAWVERFAPVSAAALCIQIAVASVRLGMGPDVVRQRLPHSNDLHTTFCLMLGFWTAVPLIVTLWRWRTAWSMNRRSAELFRSRTDPGFAMLFASCGLCLVSICSLVASLTDQWTKFLH